MTAFAPRPDGRVAPTALRLKAWIRRSLVHHSRGHQRRGRSVRPGASTRPTFAPGPRWATCIVPLIRRARQWTHCSSRGAVMAFFRKALAFCAPRWPRKITLDGHKPSHLGLRRLRREDHRCKYVLVRKRQYLNNVVEQDHRAIKGRCRSMLSFKSYRTATITLAGLELVHRIRKRQFKFGPGRWTFWSLKKQ